ncbi:hypothetical protein SY88_22155 [Clostridiales bacterium PH28_bin88]|nr:hypothetical protein SY88_22155 [Clostridiales bacterium PH28_bin88]
MEVILAAHAGLCFGVKRALRKVQQAVREEKGPIFSLGPLIHNPQEVARLEREGLLPVESLGEVKTGRVVIRSHGVPPEIIQQAVDRDLTVIDATCPDVRRVQQLAQRLQEDGYQVVVVGDREHPEVEGLIGWTGGKAWVVGEVSEAEALPDTGRIGVVAQTTQPVEKLEQVVEVLRGKAKELVVHNTICHATRQRQEAARKLARSVDAMVVIGGRNSANTGKLVQICAGTGTATYHVERAADLQPQWFEHTKRVGVTAGASTPDWIIEEVVKRMTEFNQEEVKNAGEVREQDVAPVEPTVEAAPISGAPAEVAPATGGAEAAPVENKEDVNIHLAENMKDLRKGEIVTGTVVQVKNDEVLIDVGGKSEGIIPVAELSHRPVNDPGEVLKVGDQVDVYVLRVENEEGHPILSKKRADRKKAWEKLETSFKEQAEIQAPVVEVVKGGLLVDVGINGFVPASLVERGYVENLETYLGKTLRLKIIEIDRNKNKVVLSQKAILEEEYERKRKETWEDLAEGQVRHGVVRRLTNFGAFVDIGGVDGLLHVSEISWGRVDHPKNVLSEGQELDVMVLGVDREAGKVSLGLKQLLANPWHTAAQRYQVGSIVEGKVLRIAPFGAFVEVEPGIEGLVHISQLADRHVAKTEEVVSVGDVIPVKVLSVDQEAQRMSLSLREAQGTEKRRGKEEAAVAPPAAGEKALTLGDLFKDELGELLEEKENE